MVSRQCNLYILHIEKIDLSIKYCEYRPIRIIPVYQKKKKKVIYRRNGSLILYWEARNKKLPG